MLGNAVRSRGWLSLSHCLPKLSVVACINLRVGKVQGQRTREKSVFVLVTSNCQEFFFFTLTSRTTIQVLTDEIKNVNWPC